MESAVGEKTVVEKAVAEPVSVAVIRDGNGDLSSLGDSALIEIHRKGRRRGWKCVRTIPWTPGPDRSPAAVRGAVADLAAALEDARILVGTSVSGIAYTVLDQRGFCICELDAFSPDCLDALTAALEAPPREAAVPDRPWESGTPGVYDFDLAPALAAYPDLSSKKILRPFLRGGHFSLLRLSCGHLPPWLLPELAGLGLEWRREEGDATRLDIFPQTRNSP
jgi:Fe-only nitrogenase accessory protein AnfO